MVKTQMLELHATWQYVEGLHVKHDLVKGIHRNL